MSGKKRVELLTLQVDAQPLRAQGRPGGGILAQVPLMTVRFADGKQLRLLKAVIEGG